MENRLIMFQNITVAVKARNILAKHGVHAYVQKTPVKGNKVSCGYSVAVKSREEEAMKILHSHGVSVLGVMGGSET